MNVKIENTERIPDTVNAWGFGGAVNKVRYTMTNGDVWVSGTAKFRHAPDQKYIQLLKASNENYSPDWNGGFALADKDIDLKGSPVTYIKKYYTSKQNKNEKL